MGCKRNARPALPPHYESRKELIRERQRANWQQYARENAATLVTKNRQRRKETKAAEAEYRTKYRTLNAPKVAAKNQVWSHLLTGRIKKTTLPRGVFYAPKGGNGFQAMISVCNKKKYLGTFKRQSLPASSISLRLKWCTGNSPGIWALANK